MWRWPLMWKKTHDRFAAAFQAKHREDRAVMLKSSAQALADAARNFQRRLEDQKAVLDEQVRRLSTVKTVRVSSPGAGKVVMFIVEVDPALLQQAAAFEMVDGRQLIADRVAEAVRKQVMDSKHWSVNP